MEHNKMRILMLLIGFCLLCGCQKETSELQQPEEEQIRAICELATLECRYQNVAKGEKTKGERLEDFGKKERKYWIEYTGVMKLGIDMEKVSMRIRDDEVIIKIPEAEILSMGIEDDSFTEESVIKSDDSWFNKNKITVEDQKQFVSEAQEKMRDTMLKNTSLMKSAQDRAKMLIENYIQNLGNATGVEYNVVWKSVE